MNTYYLDYLSKISIFMRLTLNYWSSLHRIYNIINLFPEIDRRKTIPCQNEQKIKEQMNFQKCVKCSCSCMFDLEMLTQNFKSFTTNMVKLLSRIINYYSAHWWPYGRRLHFAAVCWLSIAKKQKLHKNKLISSLGVLREYITNFALGSPLFSRPAHKVALGPF